MSLTNIDNFGLCSGYWDETSNTFKQSDETDQGNCCLYIYM